MLHEFAFPTAVGMNRLAFANIPPILRVPHSRGDEPVHFGEAIAPELRSPQPWG